MTDPTGTYRFPALRARPLRGDARPCRDFAPAKLSDVRARAGQGAQGRSDAVAGRRGRDRAGHRRIAAHRRQAERRGRQRAGRDHRAHPAARATSATLVTSAPGVTDEARNRGIQIDGASGADNRFMIDGVDTTDLRFGTSGKALANDFVQEVQVKSSGYNAEYRASIGGVISAITKSGGNQYHGERAASTIATRTTCSATCGRPCGSSRANTTKAEYVTTPVDDFTDPGADLRSRRSDHARSALVLRRLQPELDGNAPHGPLHRNQQIGTFEARQIDQNFNYNVTGQIRPEPARPLRDDESAQTRAGRAAGDQHGRHEQQHPVALPDDESERDSLQRLVLRRRRLGRQQQDLRELHDDATSPTVDQRTSARSATRCATCSTVTQRLQRRTPCLDRPAVPSRRSRRALQQVSGSADFPVEQSRLVTRRPQPLQRQRRRDALR